MNTSEIRQEFLIADLFTPGEVKLIYLNDGSHDRGVGSANQPAASVSALVPELRTEYFAERREIGVFNIGELGRVAVDGREYALACRDALYIGRGSKEIIFSSADASHPARFYLVSLPAHKAYPVPFHPGSGQAH